MACRSGAEGKKSAPQLTKAKEPDGEAVQNGPEAQAKIKELERQIAKLDEQNLELRSQIANVAREQSGREEQLHQLEQEHAKIAELERQIAGLREERDRLQGRLENLENERETNRGRIETLEAVEKRMPDLERQIADLGRENSKLAGQIVNLRSSLLEKLRVQVEGLQDLYHEVETG